METFYLNSRILSASETSGQAALLCVSIGNIIAAVTGEYKWTHRVVFLRLFLEALSIIAPVTARLIAQTWARGAVWGAPAHSVVSSSITWGLLALIEFCPLTNGDDEDLDANEVQSIV